MVSPPAQEVFAVLQSADLSLKLRLSFCQPVLEQDRQVLQEGISGEQLVATVLTHWHQSCFSHKYFLRFW